MSSGQLPVISDQLSVISGTTQYALRHIYLLIVTAQRHCGGAFFATKQSQNSAIRDCFPAPRVVRHCSMIHVHFLCIEHSSLFIVHCFIDHS